MCNYDCFNCNKADCDNDILSVDEVREAQERDYETLRGRAYTAYQRKYQKYNQSEKGKTARERYKQSSKGIENEKRRSKRKIASGKNAEYCRAYYQRKKAERNRDG